MILGQLRMGARQAKNAALVLSCPVPKMSKGAQNDRKGWLPLLLPYGQLFQILFGVQKEVFFGAKTLFWALFSVFLMDQNPFLMTSTRICGNIINNCFKKGQKKEAFSLHRFFHVPSHLEVYERSQTHSWWSRSPGGCPSARRFVRLSWKAAQHGWRSRPICEFLQIPRASSGALCKIGPPASETGGRDWY